jgi:hypothetical protein
MNTESTGISPATPANDAPAPAQAPASPAPSTPSPTSGATPSEPYLRVNDRTVYQSREDAIKGYEEAQKRIAQLATWEKLNSAPEKGGLGFVNLKSPEDVATLLDELIELRSKAQGSTATGATPTAAGGSQPQGADQLSPEWQQYIKTLQEKAGFVTRDQLKQLEQRFEQIDQHNASEEEAKVTAAVDHGTSLLEAEMKSVGMPEDKDLLASVGAAIGGTMNQSSYDAHGNLIEGSVIDRFVKGSEAVRRDIIKSEFAKWLKFGETFATVKNANYAAQKTSAQANTPRPLSQGSAPAPTAPAPSARPNKWDHSDLNRRAREAMQEEMRRIGAG